MLKEKLLEDLKNSMKDKNIVRKNVIQMIRAAILQKEKDGGVELKDEEIMQIIAKEAKTRKDSLPSVLTPNFAFACPITFPMSFIDVAPVSFIISCTIGTISSLLNCFGKYSSIIAISSFTSFIRSSLPLFS